MKMKTPLHFVSLFAVVLAGFCFCWPATEILAQARKQSGGQIRGQGARKPASSAASAGAEPRVALVIGNGAYSDGALANSVNDARDIAAALRQLGFSVSSGENLSRRQMEEKIRDFGQKIRGGGVGMFYYAGHGVQVGGANYLIPVGAQINGESEVKYEAVDAGFVLAQMEEAKNRLNIVILDACRNNPFARSFRSASSGLASIDAPVGTLIAYATAPGRTASDGNGRNGLYTKELLAAMRVPGLRIEDVFKQVRAEVRRQSNDQQIPWEASSIEGDFYFSGAGARPEMAGPAPAPAPAPDDQTGQAMEQIAVRAYNYVASRQYDRAIAEFNEALRIDPKMAEGYVGRGSVYVIMKDFNRAIADLSEAIRLNPNIAIAYQFRSVAYRQTGRNDLADADDRTAQRLSGN
jgi:hypothetical protein